MNDKFPSLFNDQNIFNFWIFNILQIKIAIFYLINKLIPFFNLFKQIFIIDSDHDDYCLLHHNHLHLHKQIAFIIDLPQLLRKLIHQLLKDRYLLK